MINYLATVTPSQACQTYYIFASTCILTIIFLPTWLRGALMDYGARQQSPAVQPAAKEPKGTDDQAGPPANQGIKLTRLIHALEVPHSWFLHFYILSFTLSVFWLHQYITRGSIMSFLITQQSRYQQMQGKGTDLSRTAVAWALLAVQGARRLYESLVVQKRGKSSMSAIHWAVALVYYGCISVSIWIEGSGKSCQSSRPAEAKMRQVAIRQAWETGRVIPQPPSKTVGALTVIFILASLKQAECHRHLASLKKYTLPHEGWFRYIVCPHYTAECLIYLALALIAAPKGRFVNQTVLLGLTFVAVNLGATAEGTRSWYEDKFGKENVKGKWRMIPFLF